MDNFVTAKELATRYKVHPQTIRRFFRDDPTFPVPVRFGRALRWRLDDLHAWENARKLRADGSAP